jgi:molybdopterin synthase sulfur carrier subunit
MSFGFCRFQLCCHESKFEPISGYAMKVNIKYFASIRETLGQSSETRETQGKSVAALRDELLALSPVHVQALSRDKPIRMALDQTMCDESATLHEGCEVAFFPPVTGG